MSLKSDNMLLVTVANEAEGCTLIVKTTEALGKDTVLITTSTGMGTYKIEELKEAISKIESFNQSKEGKKQDDGSAGYHLP